MSLQNETQFVWEDNMRRIAKCGVCGLEQGSGEQKIIPVVSVGDGIAIYRCSEHLNAPAREGEGEPFA